MERSPVVAETVKCAKAGAAVALNNGSGDRSVFAPTVNGVPIGGVGVAAGPHSRFATG
jgi:hypothetical protein